MRVRLIAFDAFDTLFKLKDSPGALYASFYKSVASHSSRQLGHCWDDPKTLEVRFKSAFKDMSRKYPNFGSGSIGDHAWWREVVLQTYMGDRRLDAALQQEKTFIETRVFPGLFADKEMYTIMAGLRETLHQLKMRYPPFMLGVISNYDSRLPSILQSMNVLQDFNFVMTSYEAGYMKPDRRLFQDALETLHRMGGEDIHPHEAFYIGNTFETDYVGAKAAGWNALLLGNHDSTVPIPSEHVITCLPDILDHLA